MGVYHFMGLGLNPGVVTVAVDYICKCLILMHNKKTNIFMDSLFCGSGEASNKDTKGRIEGLVIFTSKEVINGSPIRNKPNCVVADLTSHLKEILKEYRQETGDTKLIDIRLCELDINNYDDCYQKIIRTMGLFRATGKQGKEIWVNLTGGTNSINLALINVVQLRGIASKVYLLQQKDNSSNIIRIPNDLEPKPGDDDWLRVLPFFRTIFDNENFYAILDELNSKDDWLLNKELFSTLKSKDLIQKIGSFELFKKEYLLKMRGYIDYKYNEQDRTNENYQYTRITSTGKALVENLENYIKSTEIYDPSIYIEEIISEPEFITKFTL